MENFIEEESRPKQNPFERPKPKINNPQELKLNATKKAQIQRVGNYRDQLNKNMLENVTKESENLQENSSKREEEKPKTVEPHKKYKIPPRINNIEVEPRREEENFLNSEEKSQNIFSRDNLEKEILGITANKNSGQLETQIKPCTNEKNLSFSDELNVSLDRSEKNILKSKEANILDSSSLSIDNKKSKGVVSRFETNIDPLNASIQNVNGFDNNKDENHTTSPLKKLEEPENKRPVIKITNKNQPMNIENTLSIPSQSNIDESKLKLKPVNRPMSDTNILTDVKNELNNSSTIIEENVISNVDNLNSNDDKIQEQIIDTAEIENFSELLRKLELLKNEIRELKNNKIAIQTNYEVEFNKNKLYLNEIDQLRQTINAFKVKEIKEGEAMLRLEIKNLNEKIEYQKKTNDLLQKENETLKNEVKKLQDYLKEMMEMKNSKAFKEKEFFDNFNDGNTKNLYNENFHEKYHLEIQNENENEKELNAVLINNEEIEPEEEDAKEIFDTEAKNKLLPLEVLEEDPKYYIEEENSKKESKNLDEIEDRNMKILDTLENPQIDVSQENLELNFNQIIVTNEPEVIEVQHSNGEYNNEIIKNWNTENFNYSFEINKNTQEEKVEEKANASNLDKNVFVEYEEPTHKQSSLWDLIEDQKTITRKTDEVSINPFEDANTDNYYTESVFNPSLNNKIQKEKKIVPVKKELSISSNTIKPNNLFTEEKIESKTPQGKIHKNLFELTSDLSDDVFSSISQENIKPAPFKKIENTNLNRKTNLPIVKPQPAVQKSQEPFANMSKDKKNTKLLNLQFNADEDIGSIFGTLTKNENKGNSLFD